MDQNIVIDRIVTGMVADHMVVADRVAVNRQRLNKIVGLFADYLVGDTEKIAGKISAMSNQQPADTGEFDDAVAREIAAALSNDLDVRIRNILIRYYAGNVSIEALSRATSAYCTFLLRDADTAIQQFRSAAPGVANMVPQDIEPGQDFLDDIKHQIVAITIRLSLQALRRAGAEVKAGDEDED